MPIMNQGKFVASASTGHTSVSTGPTDVCKTPTPGGPVPMPYPNAAVSITIGPGYTTKTLEFGAPMWTKKAKSAVSNGDQPGVALGVVSNKIMGMCEIVMASDDVDAEGGAVSRTLDTTNSNI